MLQWNKAATTSFLVVYSTILLIGRHAAKIHAFSRPSSFPRASERRLLLLSSSSTAVNAEEERVAVIVGGGPVGLASALTLSNPPHSFRCIVLEKTTGATAVAKYDASKAYLYNVNPRGLEWVAKFPSVLDKLFARGSLSTGTTKFVTVPGDPKVPIPDYNSRRMAIGRVNATAAEKAKENPKLNLADCSLWIPRHLMVELLVEACREQEEQRLLQKTDETVCPIHTFFGKSFASVEPHPLAETLRGSRPLLQVRCTDGTTYDADLVVGADGIDSGVRNCLANTKSNHDLATYSSLLGRHEQKHTWLQSRAKDFRVRRFRSPSAGIKIKCLQIVPNFKLPNITGSVIETNSETVYAIRAQNTGQGRLSLGMLPVKDPNLVRPANACVRHNHPIWSRTTGFAMKEYFEQSFPRIQWNDLIVGGTDPKDQGNTEWERFAKANGTTFPWPQYSPGSAIWSSSLPKNTGKNDDSEQQQQREAGVVLVGDACHAFPPDIGQGINSGLQDVVALDRALKGQEINPRYIDENNHNNNNNNNNKATTTAATMPGLGKALAAYQKNRRPEHRALIRLARFGGPYQYNQSWPRDRVGKLLFMLNFLFRLVLNKITFDVFPPPCLILAYQKPKTPSKRLPTYRQVMRRCDGATLVLQATLGLAVIRWVAKRFGPLFLLSQL